MVVVFVLLLNIRLGFCKFVFWLEVRQTHEVFKPTQAASLVGRRVRIIFAVVMGGLSGECAVVCRAGSCLRFFL